MSPSALPEIDFRKEALKRLTDRQRHLRNGSAASNSESTVMLTSAPNG